MVGCQRQVVAVAGGVARARDPAANSCAPPGSAQRVRQTFYNARVRAQEIGRQEAEETDVVRVQCVRGAVYGAGAQLDAPLPSGRIAHSASHVTTVWQRYRPPRV